MRETHTETIARINADLKKLADHGCDCEFIKEKIGDMTIVRRVEKRNALGFLIPQTLKDLLK